jgi:serine protease inhibitor
MPATRAPLPAVLLLLAACGGVTDQSGPPALLTGLPRALTQTETGLIAASNDFAFDLFREVRAARPAEDIFISPTSASMALGMTLNGAAGQTLDSMRTALRLGPAPLAEINAGYRSLIDLLRGLDDAVDFSIANSIWAQAGMSFRAEFLEAGRTSFDAEIRSLDFGAPATLGTINGWVSENTGGKIPKILESIASDEIMFLINAIFFKGDWRVPFDPAKTRDQPFHTAGGTTRSVPTMELEPVPLRYGSAGGHTIVELLYGNGAFAMTLVLPGQGQGIAELTAGLDQATWSAWTSGLIEQKVGLTLPRFRLEFSRELKDDLSALGMRIAFDPARADFSGMLEGAGPGDLYITRVIQKTFVDVNEEGTTAAAATAVGIGLTSAPPVVRFDRPFLFAIRERFSGTILFLGQVAELQ